MIVRWVRHYAKGARFLGLGALSLGLYATLYFYEREALELSVAHAWSFLVPIAIAFVFSFVHGAFTGVFWDTLGLKAKSVKEVRRWKR